MGNIHHFYWLMGWKKERKEKAEMNFYKVRKDLFFEACLNSTMYSSINILSTAECTPQGRKPGICYFTYFLLSVMWSCPSSPSSRLSSLDFIPSVCFDSVWLGNWYQREEHCSWVDLLPVSQKTRQFKILISIILPFLNTSIAVLVSHS